MKTIDKVLDQFLLVHDKRLQEDNLQIADKIRRIAFFLYSKPL